MVLEDAGQEILAWTGERCVPVWTESARQCAQCQEMLQRSKAHNCRLCGLRFCSLCTAKYHVPENLRLKHKSGPVRCCYSCVAECLRTRDAATPSSRPRRPGLRLSVPHAATAVHIHPPVWRLQRKNAHCLTCQRTCGQGHICRTCGDIFCSDCSVKMSVPPAFRKNGKSNPVRVCCQCRFDLYGGAVLDESDPACPAHANSFVRASSSSAESVPAPIATPRHSDDSMRAMSTPAMASLSVSDMDASSGHKASFEGSLQHGRVARVSVQWHGSTTALCILKVSMDTPLDELHDMIVEQLPELRCASFGMLCRGKPVLRDFWDIFKACHVRPVLYLSAADDGAEVAEKMLESRRAASSMSVDSSHSSPSESQPPSISAKKGLASSGHSSSIRTEGKPNPNDGTIGQVRALFSLSSERDNVLSFNKGDTLDLLVKKPGRKWWYGRVGQKNGWIPSNFVEVIPGSEGNEHRA